jgi:hypothetical protein
MLFDIICAVGCRAEHGPISSQYQALSNAAKSPICDVILGTVPASVETVQALLVNACYTEKGWLLTSMATRMALDLNLPNAAADLSTRVLSGASGREEVDGEREEDEELFRRARVWFGTFVLEHILSLDCGKMPGVTATNGMRRCRVLLRHPARTALDLRLLAQVELNSIRALAHDRLSPRSLSDEEGLIDIVQGIRVDLQIWLGDWVTMVETAVAREERSSLIINLKIQKEWSELTMLCKGLQGMGIDNVA